MGRDIGANIAEGVYAQTNADLILKFSISQKETSETIYWLELLHDGGILSDSEYENINNDAVELMKPLTTAIKKLKVMKDKE